MSRLMGYLGFNSSTPPPNTEPKQSPVRALPASWYLSEEMFQLERRAIFSRKWLFLTHQSRIRNAGDFLRYEMADFDFLVTRDRRGNVNAFHNVCRHRAYSVVEKDKTEGNAKILSCRYHGWSYAMDGSLAKAPKYDSLQGFDSRRNGLFPIHVKVDCKGFIWINLDAKDPPEIPWEEDFADVDAQARFDEQGIDFDEYRLDHCYDFQGDYNWKMAGDNFNECYHCPTTHPDIPNFLTVDAHDMEFKGGSIQHDHGAPPEAVANGMCVNSTYYFPNASMSVSKHFMMIQKFLPIGPSKTKVHYEVYKNKHSTSEDFHLIADMYARVMSEDKALCNTAQRNLQRGVYISGELHPKWEKAPLHFQQSVREVVTQHYLREKKGGREIWPARQTLIGGDVLQEDEDLCQALECGKPNEMLAW